MLDPIQPTLAHIMQEAGRAMTSKCDAHKCTSLGVWAISWPGSAPFPMCERHKEHAIEVAQAMGLYLAVEPVKDAR